MHHATLARAAVVSMLRPPNEAARTESATIPAKCVHASKARVPSCSACGEKEEGGSAHVYAYLYLLARMCVFMFTCARACASVAERLRVRVLSGVACKWDE